MHVLHCIHIYQSFENYNRVTAFRLKVPNDTTPQGGVNQCFMKQGGARAKIQSLDYQKLK